jgi:membrane-associated protease RseP (regulator of RpoE activity)
VAEPVAAAPASGSHVAVPKWVLATVAAVVGAAVMFGIGYAVGDGSSSNDSTTAIGAPFNGNGNQQAPNLPGPGNGNQQTPTFPGNGNGNGNEQTPRSPNQSVSGAFLGVATQQTTDGLEVVQVVSGSAADDAGLEVGDVIVGFDGNDVTTPAQLANAVGNLDPGDEAEIRYVRDDNTRTVTVELGSRSTTNSN